MRPVPKFFWGVATSAFQLEGSPFADWATWCGVFDKRPNATHHFDLYKEDLALLTELGVNAYRFSLEWSRIQPQEDTWDDQTLNHYQEIIDILNQNNIVPMLTIHHFTHPQWFIEKYPWHKAQSVDVFLDYIEKLTSRLTGVQYWITFNEPYVLLLGGYLDGCMPPGIKDLALATKALTNILRCHGGAYDILHSSISDARVSLAHNMATFAPCSKWNPLDGYLVRIADAFYNQSLIDALKTGVLILKYPCRKPIEIPLPIKGKVDFFGLNYYTRVHLRLNPLRKMWVELRYEDRGGHGLTDMGWEIHPEGLERILRYVSKLNVPLIVTENGIACYDSHKKNEFMKRHVDVIEKCRHDGIDVMGYFYWSLMDNYEWLRGFGARFGLYRVDFETLERKPTASATYYAYLIKSRTSAFDN